ncbi:Peptidyl-prolyl isomerase cwc27 [Coniosporium tulheliwenetii]|uniref:Peptidyl-prolyl isomerase cwc27 n=1 Tax=Coniosporium tulheliwenetii TaxID=3383036 RepID=A0ACC2Z573_9PEZI|nr:Peptidyl-prolyl isomerase cwc27 [Cladosporium sp. JES 115]
MSSLYNLEPQPTAKVLLLTTAGDLELELFAKQTPLASRNFLQLCLDGYYDGTIFHRLVPGFIIQGGDPTGTGSGGESSFDNGEPFADEFHSRLKFNRRGLLGMANTGAKDDNGSQFFLTLGETPELTGRNIMFGRIAGDTIYNLMKMGESELTEGSERPLYPTKITGTEILVNPFEDMIKRVRTKFSKAEDDSKAKKKAKRKAGKNILSFGGDEEDADLTAPIAKKPKFNTKLVSAGQEDGAVLNNPLMPKAPERKPEPPVKKSISLSPSRSPPPQPAVAPVRNRIPTRSPTSSSEPPEPRKNTTLLDRTNAQIAELKASMKRTTAIAPSAAPRKKSALEAMIPATSTRGRKRRPGGATGNAFEDQKALDLFRAFQTKLDQAPEELLPPPTSPPKDQIPNVPDETALRDGDPTPQPADALDEEAALCDLHFIVNCQSCTAWDQNQLGGDVDEDEDEGWISHSLSFAKDRLGKDLEWKRKNEEELVVIDPREKAKEIKEERKGKRDGGGGRRGERSNGAARHERRDR